MKLSIRSSSKQQDSDVSIITRQLIGMKTCLNVGFFSYLRVIWCIVVYYYVLSSSNSRRRNRDVLRGPWHAVNISIK